MISAEEAAMRANQTRMRKNRALTSRVCVIYLAVCGMIAAANIALMFLMIDFDFMIHAVFVLGILGCGYLGGYSHNNTCAIGAVVISGAALLLMNSVVYALLLAMSVPLLLFTIRANTVYDELSCEPGFPQFEPRFEEQKKKSAEADRERAALWEKQKRTALVNVDDIGKPQGSQENAGEKPDNRGIMDSL